MKNSTLLVSVLAVLMTFSSCSKIKEELKKDVVITPDAITFTIAASNDLTERSFGEQVVDLDLNALIKSQASEFGEDNIKKARLKTVTLEITNADATNDASNFEKFNVTIKTGSGAPVSLAANTTIPNTPGTTITVTPTGTTELLPYLTASSFTYSLTGRQRKATTKPLTVRMTASYDLTVGL